MILDNTYERDGFVHGATMKMTTKKIEDSLCLDPPTSQLISYETNLHTSKILNAFVIFKDNYLPVSNVWKNYFTVCTDECFCETVTRNQYRCYVFPKKG
jgi:hypothetical protein